MKPVVLLAAGLALLAMSVQAKTNKPVNPCCSFPCQNRGVCLNGREPGTYTCDCENLPFYGKHCETPYFWTRVALWFKPSPETLHQLLVSENLKWLWNIVNNVRFLHDWMIRRVYLTRAEILDTPPLYETMHAYPTIAATTNHSVYARCLPPVPLDCPTPMGVKGKEKLPDVDLLLKTFFTREKFRPDPQGSSVLMTFFAQHFTHMFFKTAYKDNPGSTWSGHGVDMTSIYGSNVTDEHRLRSFKDGKLKLQILNNEEFPMYSKDAPVYMTYPSAVPQESRFALGHPFFGLLPGLFLFQTIWMREHNRVCDILREDHPDWDDERLFQTGKLITLGQTIKIVVEDYVQHLASYYVYVAFKPEVLFGYPFQYSNKIVVEFNHLYHWHPLMPDSFNISGNIVEMKDYIFRSDLVVKHGTAAMTDSLSRQRAGHMSHHNHGAVTMHVLRDTILQGREMRFQSFNNYRARFNLKPYASFEELTGEKKMAAELERLYGDVDAVEMYVGMLLEKRRKRALFGSTIVDMGAPFSVKGLLANPLCSPLYWRPSTFGGERGFDIVKSATLKKLFCNNIKGKCPLVSFRVPEYVEGDVEEATNFDFRPPPRDEL
ncbi:prostaglandin G/H synthase 2-like [Elysia marginata]|uniref:prostaglandin-endoperoxide synthase n=1 Tax=Elysia marginata TaxID=1093978 RepID=A0AAV4JDU8_9GAST|nr:prostaglandin G/H synthase 2-like [Elysia marginata]